MKNLENSESRAVDWQDYGRTTLVDYEHFQRSGVGFDEICAAHKVYETLVGLWAPGVIEAADELGVFREIAKSSKTPAELAEVAGAGSHGMRILLDALCVYGLLNRDVDDSDGYKYSLKPFFGSVVTGHGSASLIGKFLYDRQLAWPAWVNFVDAVRNSGDPDSGRQENQIPAGQYIHLTKGISFWAPPIVDVLCHRLEELGWSSSSEKHILDVGCGTGIYSHLLLRSFRGSQAIGLDVPEICRVAIESASEFGVDDRFATREVDFWSEGWPKNQDLVVIANIFQMLTPDSAKRLIDLAASSLSESGVVCIVDQIRIGKAEFDTAQDRFAAVFAASMLATGGGDTFHLNQYDDWLESSDMHRIDLLDTPMHRIILARSSV